MPVTPRGGRAGVDAERPASPLVAAPLPLPLVCPAHVCMPPFHAGGQPQGPGGSLAQHLFSTAAASAQVADKCGSREGRGAVAAAWARPNDPGHNRLQASAAHLNRLPHAWSFQRRAIKGSPADLG
eukprot:354058-Chlamydomonas_euryale.AAC.8